MLSDREKFILHLVSMMTITRLSDTEHSEQLICKKLMADTVWTMTGERPNKNTDWSDMK